MTEVPEHLLERSRARRAALGLGGGDAPAADGGGAADGGADGAAAPATQAAAPAPVAAAATTPAEVAPPPPPPAYVQAAIDRKKIPWWAMPVVGLLPLWAVLYAGSLSEADTGELTELEEGGELYANACASCHGGGGGGGVGPAFTDGAVVDTFPSMSDHILWIYTGSTGWPADTYGATDKPVGGGGQMPAFPDLTPEELYSIVRYEREVLAGVPPEEQPGFDDLAAEIDPEGHLVVTNPEGEAVDASVYYLGEGAEAGEWEIGPDDLPRIADSELTEPPEGE